MGIKYSAGLLIAPIYLAVFIIILYQRKKIFVSLKFLIISGLLVVLCFAPWAIKNQIYFNNAFFPFFQNFNKGVNIFNKQYKIDEQYEQYKKERRKEMRYLRFHKDSGTLSLKNFTKTIWNISTSKNIEKYPSINFGFIPLIILPFFFFYNNKKIHLILLIIIIPYFLLWFQFGGNISRYAIFGIMILYALLPYLLWQNKKLFYIYILSVLVGLSYMCSLNNKNIYYLSGLLSKNQYLSQAIYSYEVGKFINDLNIEKNEKIYMNEARVAFINNNDQIISTKFNYPVESWLWQNSEDDLKYKMREVNFKYVLYSKSRYNIYKKWLQNKNLDISDYLTDYNGLIPSIYEEEEKFKKFLDKNTKSIYSDKNYTLYKLN